MRLAVVDVETTGLDPASDRITEIGIRSVKTGQSWSTLVNPKADVPPVIEAMTGLSTRLLAGEKTFGDLAESLRRRLKGHLLVGHNLRFDLGMIRAEYHRLGQRPPVATAMGVCTWKAARKVWPGRDSYKLSDVARQLGQDCAGSHRVDKDTQLTAAVFDSARRSDWTIVGSCLVTCRPKP